MTSSDGVAVIATQIAQTDRRALSEAWYSALHLARDAAPRPPRSRRAGAVAARPANAPLHSRAPAASAPASLAAFARGTHGAGPRGTETGERRRAPSETERRVGRAIAALAARPRAPVAHTVDVAGGRVRLLVQSDGRTTRIVALCSAALREPVRRAVASARFALAGAGVAVGAP